MSISHQTRFEIALEKAKRLIALRSEVASLEAEVRNTAMTLGHEAWRTTGEDQKELLEQSGILSRALQGHL